MVLLELVLVLVLLQAWVLVLWMQVRMLEALSRMLAQLLVLALVALVLVLLAELLAQVLMLLWGRTFVLFWVLAQLMLAQQGQVQVQALVQVLEGVVPMLALVLVCALVMLVLVKALRGRCERSRHWALSQRWSISSGSTARCMEAVCDVPRWWTRSGT